MAKRRNKKRKINKLRVYLVIILVSILAWFLFLKLIPNDKKLAKKGYKETSIKLILEDTELTKRLLKEEYIDFIDNNILKSDFVIANINRYESYKSNNNTTDEETIKLVNEGIDELGIDYNDRIIKFIESKYYLKRNLKRYLSYNQNYSENEIIKRVNSNIDKEFYKNDFDVDLTKEKLMIVNKFYYLGDYVPENLEEIPSKYGSGQLESETLSQFIKMNNELESKGMFLIIKSPYRSYKRQEQLYNSYKAQNGFKWAESWSARPGYSEHQTGMAIDLGTKNSSSLGGFEKTDEYLWLKENAHKFGFILRYPKGEEYITGYQFEPWHYRYVGVEAATKIRDLKITYEEYYEYYVN